MKYFYLLEESWEFIGYKKNQEYTKKLSKRSTMNKLWKFLSQSTGSCNLRIRIQTRSYCWLQMESNGNLILMMMIVRTSMKKRMIRLNCLDSCWAIKIWFFGTNSKYGK